MKKTIQFLTLLLIFFVVGCSSFNKNILRETLTSQKEKIKRVMEKPEEFELQIIYTEIIRNANNQVKFKDYTYNLNAKSYFYPASTVKLPIAVLALEKLNSIENTSINSEFSIDGSSDKFKFSQEISKVFAVSDNDASNHLLEFVGFDYLNKSMTDKGLRDFKVIHRLSTPNSGNPVTKDITLYRDDNSVVEIPSAIGKPGAQLQLKKMKKGTGYIKDAKLINAPFDFSGKNYYSLETLHNTLKRIIFPEAFEENQRFHLSKNDREFLLFSLQNLPKNAGYNPVEFYDGYGKFFMFGDTKDPMPENIKIYNKIGNAYGTMTDCAYIVDEKNKIEFMVSATILVNKNGIFNDNTYEYDEVGFPFLAELGRELYDKNLKKKSN